MARQPLRVVRDTAAAVAAYTGPAGEPVFNIDAKTLHIQDGATPGGVPMARAQIQTAPETAPAVVRDLLTTVREFRSPRSFGAVGDGVADDTIAIQAFFDWLAKGNIAWDFRGGRYRLTAPIRCYAASCYKFVGAGIGVTVFICDFDGYEKSVLNFSHPTNPAENTRPKACTISDFSVEMSGNVTRPPCNIEARYSTDFFVARVYTSHWTPFLGRATLFRISNAYNCVINEVKGWGAGCSRLSRVVTASTRFSITAGSNTLTASEACFTNDDINRGIQLFDGSRLEYFTIYGVTNATTATVDRNSYQTFSASTGCFEGAKCNISAGSNTLYISGQFQAADVGRVVYIPGAGAQTFRGNRPPLRAVITAVAPDRKSATLNRSASTSVNNRYLILSPAFELYGEADTGDYGNNDIAINYLHMEGNAGVPVLAGYGNNIKLGRLKTHGNNIEYIGGTFGAVEHVSLCNLALFNGEADIGDGSLIEGCVVNGWGQIWTHAAIAVTIGSTTGIGWAGTPFIFLDDAGTYGIVKWGNREIGTPYSPDYPLIFNAGAAGFIRHSGIFTDSGFNAPRNADGYLVQLSSNQAKSFPLATRRGKLKALCVTNVALSATVAYTINSGSAATYKEAGSVTIETAAGPLSGNTGTADRITFSVSADQRLYVENRTGSYVDFHVRVEDDMFG